VDFSECMGTSLPFQEGGWTIEKRDIPPTRRVEVGNRQA
jgi:hypothetical protein